MPKARLVVWEAVGVQDAAHFLGVSKRTIDRMVRRGTLDPFYTDGGHRRFPVAQLRRHREGCQKSAKQRQTATPAKA